MPEGSPLLHNKCNMLYYNNSHILKDGKELYKSFSSLDIHRLTLKHRYRYLLVLNLSTATFNWITMP